MCQALHQALIEILNGRGNLIDNVTNKISESTTRHGKKKNVLKRQFRNDTKLKDQIENLAG